MLKHEAVKRSPLGYAKRDSERGTLYATNGGLYLELGGALRPVTLPPDKIDTWQPVMPEQEPAQPHGSTWEPVMPDVATREPMSDQASAQAGPEDTQRQVMAQPKGGPEDTQRQVMAQPKGGPDRWADRADDKTHSVKSWHNRRVGLPLGPDRWADRPNLQADQVVVHREKRKPATV